MIYRVSISSQTGAQDTPVAEREQYSYTKNRSVGRIAVLTMMALLAICTLYYCDQQAYSNSLNPFARNYQHNNMLPAKKLLLSFEPGEILDMPGKDIFIINSKNGKTMYWVDVAKNQTLAYTPATFRYSYERVNAAWYSDSVLYILNGNGRNVIKKYGFPVRDEKEVVDSFRFTVMKTHSFADTRLIVRKSSDTFRSCNLGIYNAASNSYVQEKWPKSKFNTDCLSTDGSFAYDGANGFYYVNLYNSRIIKFDSSMNMIFENNTIDDTRSYPVVKFDSAKKSYNFFSPHRIINYCVAADSSRIFVISTATATNDLRSTSSKNTPLDVYSAANGSYLYSRHLQDVNINRVGDLKQKNGLLYMIYGKELLIFKP
jgi:hypothetical protein